MTVVTDTTNSPAMADATSGEHDSWMRRAIDLAARSRGWTSPNPMVGSVVVKDGKVIADGYHERAGQPHAEAVALERAGESARGADLYVTLEPCSHHGRTPPCTDRIIRAGIRRVVCAHVDPDPRVNGRGIRILRDAGVEVIVGPGEAESRRLNEHYLHWKRTGRPWITAKWAQTLDGQVATSTGSSKWITGEAARTEAHRQRSFHDAVLVGIGTAHADDPGLDVRHVEGHQPLHVVLDARLELPLTAKLAVPGKTIIVAGEDAPAERAQEWTGLGVEVMRVPLVNGRVDLDATVKALGERNVVSVFVEGGPTIVTAFLRAGLVQRVMVFTAPKILGTGTPSVAAMGITDIANALHLSDVEMTQYGSDWCTTGLIESRTTDE